MSTIAVLISLGGTAFATATLTGADIKNNTITGIDIKANSVPGADITNGTITSADIADNAVTAADLSSSAVAKAQPTSGSTSRNLTQINDCTTTELLTLDVSLTHASTIMVTASGSYAPFTSDLLRGKMFVELRDTNNSTTLATLPVSDVTVSNTLSSTTMTSNGLLDTSTDPLTLNHTAYVAAPGSYVLRSTALGTFGTCANNPIVANPSLSYIAFPQ